MSTVHEPEKIKQIYKPRNTLFEIMSSGGYDVSVHGGFSSSDTTPIRPVALTDRIDSMKTMDEILAKRERQARACIKQYDNLHV